MEKCEKFIKGHLFKISATMWWTIWITLLIKFCIRYSSDIHQFYIIKKHETVTDNLPIRWYADRIKRSIISKIKTGYYLEFLMPEMIKLLGSTKNKITKGENGKIVPHLAITETY